MSTWIPISLAAILGVQGARGDDLAVEYARQVKPLLEKRCYACHGALQQKSGLRADTVDMLKKGGESGPVLVPGRGAGSRLIEVVSRTGDVKMPPEGEGSPLTAGEIQILTRWIDEGANGPADEQPQTDPRDWWSYRPPQRAAIPAVKHPDWVRTPIDAFLAARHDERGLTPAEPSDQGTWLRRVHLDFIGLPPTRAELHRFLADKSADACEKVVDDLLQRPQYGERWGRHWMDVWRYSDWYGSRGGNEIRYSQRHIWRWRDWIVESLNEDKPYDRMIVEMLAADEVAPTDPRILPATGFIGRNWYKFDRNVWMFDLVEHTGQAFLGLTLKCARCHDHKFDPITQEEYYRFRAFFEPHDVRTDRLDAATGTEKDATLGEVLKDGIARVYDKQLDIKTHLFQRGDNRYPEESRPLPPGVPAAFRVELPTIAPVPLPVEAWYPSLHPTIADGLLRQAQAAVAKWDAEIESAKTKLRETQRILAVSDPGNRVTPAARFFHDDFSAERPQEWQVLSGEWVYEQQRLIERAVTSFATLVSKQSHPRDFSMRLRYRPLAPAGLRSVGFSFDYIDAGNSQDIYTHTGDTSQTVQAFHRFGGQQVYPAIGIVQTTDLKVGEEALIELVVRGQSLVIRLNGSKRLDYVMPVPRRDGKFALWVHNGSAEFLELTIHELIPDRDSLQRDVIAARSAVELLERKRGTAQAEITSLQLRINAERAKHGPLGSSEAAVAALHAFQLAASRAEREVAVVRAEETLLQSEQHRIAVRPLAHPQGAVDALIPDNAPVVVDAEAKFAVAQRALEAAKAAVVQPDGKYAPLGEQFPTHSSGRRTALAQWITSPRNPRAARVAVNHIWLRHFGQALVPSVANFGLNGDQPSHPELLDWLAVELMENGWRMKPIHRMITLSNAYRMTSAFHPMTPGVGGVGEAAAPEAAAGILLDPGNRDLWRMNSRRMEAEVVRDSLLHTAGTLDLTRGGPEIPESQGQTSLRRSLYFRNTPNEKMKFLELFDVADPNACYRRRESVVPQQALALMNSALALDQSRILAEKLTQQLGAADDESANTAFITAAFETILSHSPTPGELAASLKFLTDNRILVESGNSAVFPAAGQPQRGPSPMPGQRARENLVHVLFNHNNFVTIR